MARWIGHWALKFRGSTPWSCAEASGKLCIPHSLSPPSHNGDLVYGSKFVSIDASCIGACLASTKVKSVEYV